MASVDRWVVQTTLGALSRNAFQLAPDRSVAINISGQTLGDPLFLEFVVECLDRTGVAPDQVCFEIAESAVIGNMDNARRFVGVLHGMGCKFTIDDFGSGVASFSSLKNLPLDYLKLDGSFMRNLAKDSGQPDHGDRDDQARAHAQLQDHRRAGGRQRRARRRPQDGRRFRTGFVIARPAQARARGLINCQIDDSGRFLMSVAQAQGSAPCRFRGQHPTVARPASRMSARERTAPAARRRDLCPDTQRGLRASSRPRLRDARTRHPAVGNSPRRRTS